MSHRRYQEEKDKRVKERLVKLLESEIVSNKVDEDGLTLLEKVWEWLRDDFGMNVKREWNDIKIAILNNKEIKARDLAVFLITEGTQIDDSYWSE